MADHPPQLTLCKESLLFLLSSGSPHPLYYPVVEQPVPVGVVQHAGKFLEVQPHTACLESTVLEVSDETLQVTGGDIVNRHVSIGLKVAAHETV